jgi:hypothetical protein
VAHSAVFCTLKGVSFTRQVVDADIRVFVNELIILFPMILSKRTLVVFHNSFASAHFFGYILLAI